MNFSQSEYYELLNRLDSMSQTSTWEIAGVVATFLAVLVALFFPLRDYIRRFPKLSIKARIPEIREPNLDEIRNPHVVFFIKNLSSETLYIKSAYLTFGLKSYHKFRIRLHLGLPQPIKILPYSEEPVTFLIYHKDAENGRNPIKKFLSTYKQIAEQYLQDFMGFEDIVDSSYLIQTNLGYHHKKIPKYAQGELLDELCYMIWTLDKDRQKIIHKYLKGRKISTSENFNNYLDEMKRLEEIRRKEYEDMCIKKTYEEKLAREKWHGKKIHF